MAKTDLKAKTATGLYDTPISNKWASMQTSKTDTLTNVANNSVFTANNNYNYNSNRNAYTQSSTCQESSGMSFTEKCSVFLTGLSCISATVGLVTAGKACFDEFCPEDEKKSSAPTTTSTQGATDSLKSALAEAEKTRDYTNLKAEVEKQKITIDENETKITSLDDAAKAYDTTIAACKDKTETTYVSDCKAADDTYQKSVDAALAIKNDTIKPIQASIDLLNADLKAAKAAKPFDSKKVSEIETKIKEQEKLKDEAEKAYKVAEEKAAGIKKTSKEDALVRLGTRLKTAEDAKAAKIKERDKLKADTEVLRTAYKTANAKLAERGMEVSNESAVLQGAKSESSKSTSNDQDISAGKMSWYYDEEELKKAQQTSTYSLSA